MKLLFKATAVLPIYSSAELGDVKDGEIVNAPDDLAARLLIDFPDNFSIVENQDSAVETLVEFSRKSRRGK